MPYRKKCKILLVEDDIGLSTALTKVLKKEGYCVSSASDVDSAIMLLSREIYHIVITDLVLPGEKDGLFLLKKIKENWPEVEVVVMTGYATVESAVEAMKLGAYDYLQKPFDRNLFLSTISKIVKMKHLMNRVVELEQLLKGGKLIGKSKPFIEVVEKAKMVAKTEIPILILGESGTGKEVLARFIHENSPRVNGPFVTVNCPAIPRDLFESELFGHKKGAFTGAIRDHSGLFVHAEKGTLFLDEIAEMPPELQPKLLRAIENKTIKPVGANDEIFINTRIIAASNRDIEKAVEEGTFRSDLYYRFVVILRIPPLRERKEDIPLLTNYFIEKFNKVYKRNVKRVAPEAMDVLIRYHWPGNVRELENTIEGLFAYGVDNVIKLSDLPPHIRDNTGEKFTDLLSLKELEKELIIKTLKETGGNKSRTANILKVSRATLYRKLKEYGLLNKD